MMDPSELLPILAAGVVAVLGIAAFLRVRRLASRSLRLTLAGLTAVLALGAVLVAGASLFFDVNYTRHLPPLVSPGRSHVAIVTYTVNDGTGVDQVEVAIRRPWSPYAHRVFAGPGHYQPGSLTPDPALQWTDDSHLEIAFHTYMKDQSPNQGPGQSSQEAGCAALVDGITVTCVENRVHMAQ